MSEPRLVAGTRAELPGAGAAVLAAGVCQAPHPPRDRLRDPTRRGAAGNLEGDEGKTLLVRWVWRGLKKKKKTEADPTRKRHQGAAAKRDFAGQRSQNTAHALTRAVGVGWGP